MRFSFVVAIVAVLWACGPQSGGRSSGRGAVDAGDSGFGGGSSAGSGSSGGGNGASTSSGGWESGGCGADMVGNVAPPLCYRVPEGWTLGEESDLTADFIQRDDMVLSIGVQEFVLDLAGNTCPAPPGDDPNDDIHEFLCPLEGGELLVAGRLFEGNAGVLISGFQLSNTSLAATAARALAASATLQLSPLHGRWSDVDIDSDSEVVGETMIYTTDDDQQTYIFTSGWRYAYQHHRVHSARVSGSERTYEETVIREQGLFRRTPSGGYELFPSEGDPRVIQASLSGSTLTVDGRDLYAMGALEPRQAGAACSTDADCRDSCLAPDENHPGGECSESCHNNICDSGALCYEGDQGCRPSCVDDGDCRSGYSCYQFMCWAF